MEAAGKELGYVKSETGIEEKPFWETGI